MRSTTGEKIFYAFNYTILFLIGMSCVLPLVHVLALSFSDKHAIASGAVTLWPVNLDYNGYLALFEETQILKAFRNSLIITLVGTALNVFFTVLAAYPLSKRYFIGRRFYSLAIVFTMIFTAGLIPNYLLLKSLGLLNNYGSLWLPGLVSVWNLMVLRTFFEGVPEELEEAARIDGASEWRLLAQIVLPLSGPVIAAISLFYGVTHWNAFMNVLIYINKSSMHNMTVLVQQMIKNQSLLQEMASTQPEMAAKITPESVKAAGVIVMTIPMLIVYPFLQKYFVKGAMIGAVKG